MKAFLSLFGLSKFKNMYQKYPETSWLVTRPVQRITKELNLTVFGWTQTKVEVVSLQPSAISKQWSGFIPHVLWCHGETICTELTALDWAAWNDNWNSSKAFWLLQKFPLHETMTSACLSNSHWRNVRLSSTSPHSRLSASVLPFLLWALTQSPWCKPQNSLRSCQWICYLGKTNMAQLEVQRVWTSSQTLSGFWSHPNSFFLSLLFQCLEVLTQKIKNVEVLRLYRTANKISPRRSPWWINTWLSFAQLCKSAFKVIQAKSPWTWLMGWLLSNPSTRITHPMFFLSPFLF